MEEGLTETDMEAAQQLVQLTGGEEEGSKVLQHNDSQKKEEKGEKYLSRADQISGREKEEEVKEDWHQLRKRQRFRSLASIYKMTRPISNGHHGYRKKRMQGGKQKVLDMM